MSTGKYALAYTVTCTSDYTHIVFALSDVQHVQLSLNKHLRTIFFIELIDSLGIYISECYKQAASLEQIWQHNFLITYLRPFRPVTSGHVVLWEGSYS